MLMLQPRSNGAGGAPAGSGVTSSTMTSGTAAVPPSPFPSSVAAWPYGSGPAGSGGGGGGANGTGASLPGTMTGTPSRHHGIAAPPLHHHHHQHHPSATTMLLMSTNNQALNVMNGVVVAGTNRGKPRRGMMRRAVFSDAQRKGLERRFQVQKYISKPDRKRLADKLSLKDSQVITMRNVRTRKKICICIYFYEFLG